MTRSDSVTEAHTIADHVPPALREAAHTALECAAGCVMNEAAGPVIAVTFGLRPFLMATGVNLRKTLKNALKHTQFVFISVTRKVKHQPRA